MSGPPAGPPGPGLLLPHPPPSIIAAQAAAPAIAIAVDPFVALRIRMVETLSPTRWDRAV
jgi:hypothetical protein